jgi:undecaprenyl pyrophosphate synthase
VLGLNKIKELLQKKNVAEKPTLKHVILNLFPFVTTDEKEKRAEDYRKFLDMICEIMNLQVEKDIPIFTLNLGKTADIIDQTALHFYCHELLKKANEHKINITIFGRWYDVSGELVEALKIINNETKDYDNFFFNICINYDSKQEIADGCRVIIRKILDEKTDIDNITSELLKENIYSSYFVPPDIIIESTNKYSGTFNFDSQNARIVFLNKDVKEIAVSDVAKLL